MKLKNWLKDWLKVYKEPYISKKHYKFLVGITKNHISSELLEKEITKINAFEIQKTIQNCKYERTAQEVYNLFHASLKIAYKLGYIKKDISELLLKPKHKTKLGQALTHEELQEFFVNINGTRCEMYFKFCLYSGCRRSEALNLKWCDIDYINKVIHIKGTKTDTSDRFIPLFEDLEILLDILSDCNLSFPYSNNRIFRHRADFCTKQFKKYCPNHKLHDLRHTFATKCLECGVSMKVVQSWLGHSDFDTTANIYSHCSCDFSQNESNKLKF